MQGRLIPLKRVRFFVLLLFVSFNATPATAGTTIYPPTNIAAGGGLLYFPQGGDASLFAVPVLSTDLADALKEQTAVLQKQVEATEAQTEEIKKLQTAFQRSAGNIQCTSHSGNVDCVNIVTGRVCGLSGGGPDGAYWSCMSSSLNQPYNP